MSGGFLSDASDNFMNGSGNVCVLRLSISNVNVHSLATSSLMFLVSGRFAEIVLTVCLKKSLFFL